MELRKFVSSNLIKPIELLATFYRVFPILMLNYILNFWLGEANENNVGLTPIIEDFNPFYSTSERLNVKDNLFFSDIQ